MKNRNPKVIGAITVIQPWAHVILHKGKNVENRPTNSHYRGTVAIHASSKNSKAWFDSCSIKVDRDSVPFGSVVAFAQLTDVITRKQVTGRTRKWFEGEFGYVLTDVMVLKKPIPTKGERLVWKLKGKVLKECLAQLSATQIRRLKPFAKVAKTSKSKK